MDDPIEAYGEDAEDHDGSRQDKRFSGAEFDLIDPAAVQKDKTDDVADQDDQQDIEERAQPVIAQMFEKPFQGRLCDQKGKKRRQGQSQKKTGIGDAEAFLFERFQRSRDRLTRIYTGDNSMAIICNVPFPAQYACAVVIIARLFRKCISFFP